MRVEEYSGGTAWAEPDCWSAGKLGSELWERPVAAIQKRGHGPLLQAEFKYSAARQPEVSAPADQPAVLNPAAKQLLSAR
jgi:hypothetical protein